MPTIEEIRQAVAELGKQYGVERIFLFGSYARGDNNDESDIDLRIDPGNIRGLFQLCGFRNQLEDTLGRKVDVLTTDSLYEEVLKDISQYEIVLYDINCEDK